MLDRESINHLVIFVIAALILAGIIFIGIQRYREMATEQVSDKIRKEIIIKRQIKENQRIIQEINYQPPSQEEIDAQIEEIQRLQSQLNSQ